MKRGCNKNPGPGPGAYLLPPTVGYAQHDWTRDRQPAYSMGSRQVYEFKSIGPGPVFEASKFDRFGSTKGPSYSMAAQLKPLTSFRTPGPGTYSPENWKESTPKFSLLQRLPTASKFQTPAPNTYTLKSCLNGTTEAFGLRLDNVWKDPSPGPARYDTPALNTHRWRMPQYSIAKRTPLMGDRSLKPGPNAYLPEYNIHTRPPKYSFGQKHSDCETVALTDADRYPPGCP